MRGRGYYISLHDDDEIRTELPRRFSAGKMRPLLYYSITKNVIAIFNLSTNVTSSDTTANYSKKGRQSNFEYNHLNWKHMVTFFLNNYTFG